MHYLIGLFISAILSLSPAEAANVNRTTQVTIAPQAIVVAKPKPAKPKAQTQQYMIIKMNDAMITSY